jgi:hypothetical protein
VLDAIVHTLLAAALLAAATRVDAASEAEGLARRALAERLDVAPESFERVSVEPAEWGDTSLGCPEKGMMYAQVVTSGYRVLLRSEDKVHDVRVASGNAVVCDKETPRAGARKQRTPRGTATANAYGVARRELAARLGIAETEVAVRSIRPLGESDQPPCPQGVDATLKRGSAFVVELSAAGETYRYLSDGTRAVACEGGPAGSPSPKAR